MTNLDKDIDSGNYKCCYLFFGEEDYLRFFYEKRLIKKIVPDDAAFMNLDIKDGKSCTADNLDLAFKTPPFMSEKRLTVYKDTGLFEPGRKDESEKAEKYVSSLLDAKNKPAAVVVFSESKVDKRSRFYKTVEKSGGAVEFKTPSEKSLVDWTLENFKKRGCSITPAAAEHLVKNVSGMSELSLEIKKLISYKNGGEINLEDTELVSVKSLEAKIFGLISAIGKKDIKTASEEYLKLVAAKESPVAVISLMARQFGLILRCVELKAQNKTMGEAAEILGVKRFAAEEALRQGGLFSRGELLSAYSDCLSTDVRLKTGRVDAETGAELLVIKYSSAMKEGSHAL